MTGEDTEPGVKIEVNTEGGSNGTINLKVMPSSGEEVYFKIKKSTKLGKLKAAYAAKLGKAVASIRFLYDGVRVQDEDTPLSLDMDEDDAIDVMVEQVGGSRTEHM